MESRRNGKAPSHGTKGEADEGLPLFFQEVAKKFVRIYYGILNNHPEQLFRFYGEGSTVIVSEFGTSATSFSETADSSESIRQLHKTVFNGVTCKIKTALPQFTVEDGVLLLVSGILTKAASGSKDADEHCFTQALVLAPQDTGYYILNDTLHIMGSLSSAEATPTKKGNEESAAFRGRFYPLTNSSSSMIPITPRPLGNTQPVLGGKHRSTSSEGEHGGYEIKSDSDSDKSSDAGRQRTPFKTTPHSTQLKARPKKPFKAVPPSAAGSHSSSVPVRVSVGVLPPQTSPGHPKAPGSRGETRPMPVPSGHGVFIARLPFGIQAEEVEKSFSVFGPVLNGAEGIQVRDGRNGCYAFVTFETCASAQEAIDKGAIVQGKRVYVEPRYQRQEANDQSYPIPMTAPPPPSAPAARMAAPNAIHPPPASN